MRRAILFAGGLALGLAAGHSFDPAEVRADWSPESGRAVVGGASNRWYDQAGQAWRCERAIGIVRWPELDLPMEVAEVRFFDADFIVTWEDEVWQWQEGAWHSLGVIPGGDPVGTAQKSFGRVKAGHRTGGSQ